MPDPKRILLISYLFPPIGGVGVQRALNFAKHLPDQGFDVHVLTAKNASAATRDEALVRQIPAGVKVHSAFTPEMPFEFRQKLWRWFSRPSTARAAQQASGSPQKRSSSSWRSWPARISRRILCPEPEVLWTPFALRKARKIIRRHDISAVVVTAPPFSSFLIGNTLKREFPHIKLISDFRDEWLKFYVAEFEYQRDDYVRRRAQQIQRETVELSDHVVLVAPSVRDSMVSMYPDVDPKKFALVPNGYDPNEIVQSSTSRANRARVVISHVGTVYSATSPRQFLDAVDALPDNIRDAIDLQFIGRVASDHEPVISGRRSNIRALGFLPRSEGLAYMADSDFLLVVMHNAYTVPGKLYEYLAMGIPIIAIGPPDGDMARIVKEAHAGWCVAPDDTEGIQDVLRRIVAERSKSVEFQPDWELIRRFERPRLVAQFGLLMA